MAAKVGRRPKMSSFQVIILGFAAVILAGTLLLSLPFAASDGVPTPLRDALFTAVSAVCVTGLIVRDTALHWSGFGQAVILLMIQIGGFGVVTVAAAFSMISGQKIGLMQRSTMREAMSAHQTGGIVQLAHFIQRGVLCAEFCGALLLAPVMCRRFGLRGIWMSLFTSVSAFCNAGFDVMGSSSGPFSSLTSLVDDPWACTVVILLIVTGGIGFLTWDDIRVHGANFRKYSLQSKTALTVSAVLIFFPAVFLWFFEYGGLPAGGRLLRALFQSVTTRTAGFNTTDLAALSGAGKTVMIVLMLIGGSPGSTAGGMKTTTVAILLASALSVFKNEEDAHLFGRRIARDAVRSASALLMLYLTLFTGGAAAISLIEGLPVGDCLFETASAVGTVGLTLGITPGLHTPSLLILIVLMFLGRVGGLTIIHAAFSGVDRTFARLPQEQITVG